MIKLLYLTEMIGFLVQLLILKRVKKMELKKSNIKLNIMKDMKIQRKKKRI